RRLPRSILRGAARAALCRGAPLLIMAVDTRPFRADAFPALRAGDAAHPRVALGLVFVALFLSGGTGLIYEVVWTRQLSDVMGSTALAMTTVFSAFMVALALGALVIGRSGRRGGQALVLYGQLEIGIGLTALATSMLLIHAPSWLAVYMPDSPNLAVELVL